MSEEGAITLRLKLKEETKEILFKSDMPLAYKLERQGNHVTIKLHNPIKGPKRIVRTGLEKPEEDEV